MYIKMKSMHARSSRELQRLEYIAGYWDWWFFQGHHVCNSWERASRTVTYSRGSDKSLGEPHFHTKLFMQPIGTLLLAFSYMLRMGRTSHSSKPSLWRAHQNDKVMYCVMLKAWHFSWSSCKNYDGGAASPMRTRCRKPPFLEPLWPRPVFYLS